MANSDIFLNVSSGVIDTFPLLMDHIEAVNEHRHEGPIMPANRAIESTGIHSVTLASSPEEHAQIAMDAPSISPGHVEGDNLVSNSLGRSSSSSSRLHLIPRNGLLRRSNSTRQQRNNNQYIAPQRSSPLNSGWWISIELLISLSQIIASIVVLSVSRHEKPRAPLGLWLIGYTVGCVAMLPLMYWRYRQRHARQQDEESVSVSVGPSSWTSSSPSTAQTDSQHAQQSEDLESGLPSSGGYQMDPRIAKYMDRFKMVLDCFFAVWFVVGNVWIFGGHSSADEAPNLYRLCIVFLTFSCISYAMPLVICATVCCCLPCIVTLMSYREDHGQAKGALPDVIAALPIYKFRQKHPLGKPCKDENESDSESLGEGGIFAPGTAKERVVTGEDAVCCICLGKYKDGVDLKELQCSHFFHADCVEKWLKINATCPLCKHEVSAAGPEERSG